ncbi:hypothetical protein RA279_29070, partial [Pseudomonas syringae pv. tagetis]|uniref:hypothetical protein n=1 Tax=Pseudomonas syringae group genomosp. 7 TaxID=251699 RepID=UPI00376FE94E
WGFVLGVVVVGCFVGVVSWGLVGVWCGPGGGGCCWWVGLWFGVGVVGWCGGSGGGCGLERLCGVEMRSGCGCHDPAATC